MEGVVEELTSALGAVELRGFEELATRWRGSRKPLAYGCLGCDPCHAADASNALEEWVPTPPSPGRSMSRVEGTFAWPPIPGEYRALGRGPDRPVAVSTLASPGLAAALAEHHPAGLSIVGKTETENVGVEKVVQNLLATPEIRFLLLAGNESEGHRPGQTLLSLARSGVDGHRRVIGSGAPRPILNNLLPSEVERFRTQVRVVDMVGCRDAGPLLERIMELAREAGPGSPGCGCGTAACAPRDQRPEVLEISEEPHEIVLDPAGYFVILPDREAGVIHLEHYDYHNRLLRTLRGGTARALCRAVLLGGWVSRADHAAYLGRELERAEASICSGKPFVQDRA